jgi:hypothetical protein
VKHASRRQRSPQRQPISFYRTNTHRRLKSRLKSPPNARTLSHFMIVVQVLQPPHIARQQTTLPVRQQLNQPRTIMPHVNPLLLHPHDVSYFTTLQSGPSHPKAAKQSPPFLLSPPTSRIRQHQYHHTTQPLRHQTSKNSKKIWPNLSHQMKYLRQAHPLPTASVPPVIPLSPQQ